MRSPLAMAGSYESQSPLADAQLTRNWIPEVNESKTGKSPLYLYPTPGLSVFSTLKTPSVRGARGSFEINGRAFFVHETTLWEVDSAGVATSRGTVEEDTLPVSMASSRTQLLIASGGRAYILTLATNVLTTIATATLNNVSQVAYIDGFFLASIKDSNQFRISTLLDGTLWPGLQIIAVSVFPGNIISMVASHRELWVLGERNSVSYYDAGTSQIFEVIPGSTVEFGSGAIHSAVLVDETIMWLGSDNRGAGRVYRMEGYSSRRISNHAVEHAIQGYSTISDAVGYSYQDRGHTFYVLWFPTADVTWVFDTATGFWHERSYLRAGQKEAHLSRTHVFAFNKHLVGDRQSGVVYEMTIDNLDDDGAEIRRTRRFPHISNESKFMLHHFLQLDFETGLGPVIALTDGDGNPRDPQAMLRWSDDGGHTWSNEHLRDCGQVGKYRKRVRWLRLGRSRDRIYEVSVSDPIKWNLIDAFLNISPGTGQ